MAVTLVSILDSASTDFTAGGCIEEIAEGNLSVTISTTETLDTTSIESWGGYVDGSLTDNLDGTWTFEVDPEAVEGEPCIEIIEYIPEDCLNVCPTITLTQTIDGANYSTDFALDTEYSFSSIVINSLSYPGISGTITDVVSGDCITYSFVLELAGEGGSSCTYSFDLTLPACDTSIISTDCTTTDFCTVNTPTIDYSCGESGVITITTDNGAEAAVVSEETFYSYDGLTYVAFTNSFNSTSETGYIKYVVDYDDGCAEQEIIIPFVCTIDCDATFDYNCTYLEGSDEFVATFTDDNTIPVLTDTIEYFVDGGVSGTPYVSGTPISAVGINRIDWVRTIVFDAPCPDKVIEFYCSKVEEDCTYPGFSLTAVYDAGSDSVIPTFTGDETILDVSEKSYSVDGSTFSSWLGGAVPTNSFATFVWTIQRVGCNPICLVATAARSQCDTPIDVNINTVNPIDINANITNTNNNPVSVETNIINENPIDVNVGNVVQIDGDFCCDDNGGGTTEVVTTTTTTTNENGDVVTVTTTVENPCNCEPTCPEPTVVAGTPSTITAQTNQVYGSLRTWFTESPQIYYETNGRVFVQGSIGEFIELTNVWSDSAGDFFNDMRLNKSGVWADDPNANDVTFGFCVNIPFTGTFSVGFAADNEGYLKIDGEDVITIVQNATIPSADEQTAHKYWFVCEIELTAGEHLFSIFGRQATPGTDIAVGFELYDATVAELKAMTSASEIDAVVIETSRTAVQTQDLSMVSNVAGGFSCPDGSDIIWDGCTPKCTCDESPTIAGWGSSGDCPDNTCGTVLAIDANCEITWDDSLCPDFYAFALEYFDGTTWNYITNVSPHTALNVGSYRLVGMKPGCPAVVLDEIDACCIKIDNTSGFGGSGQILASTIGQDGTLAWTLASNTSFLGAADRFVVYKNNIKILDTGYMYDIYQSSSCPETNGHPITDLSAYTEGQDVSAEMVTNVGLTVLKGNAGGKVTFNLSVVAGDYISVFHNDPTCEAQQNFTCEISCV